MRHLGYDKDGNHPDGRRLVFVGDLTDRGPDSPAVVKLVQRLIETGRAQCVLGNHDLNILLDHRKHDNGWFYGEEFKVEGKVVPQVLADDSIRGQVLDFFRTLPIALERDNLRVVHAFWQEEICFDLYPQTFHLFDLTCPQRYENISKLTIVRFQGEKTGYSITPVNNEVRNNYV